MNKLACFDLDGTLFNTDLVNYYSYKKALEEEGFKLDKERYISEFNGRHYTYFLPIITDNSNEEVIEKIHNRKKELYNEFLSEAIVNEKLFDIIDSIKKNNYKTAVVTTASFKNTHEILNYFNKNNYFDLIITSEDYERKKPYPDSFLLAIEKFNTSPQNTIVFEDSEIGIKAAREAGTTVFVVDKF